MLNAFFKLNEHCNTCAIYILLIKSLNPIGGSTGKTYILNVMSVDPLDSCACMNKG